MRKVFYYDSVFGSDRKEWKKLLPGANQLKLEGTRLVGGDPTRGDVIVCHRVDNKLRRELDKLDKSGVYVIDVALNDREPSFPKANTYQRAKGVRLVDARFSACFQNFLRHLDANTNQTPDWRLLEGPPPPDALLAYHLFGFVAKDTDKAERDKLRDDAIEEVKAIASADEHFDDAAKSVTIVDDTDRRRQFLRACS